jgi:hypothetical protein
VLRRVLTIEGDFGVKFNQISSPTEITIKSALLTALLFTTLAVFTVRL